MRDCLFNLIGEIDVDIKELIQLAEEFGLPCIERDGLIFIIGLEQIVEFDTFNLEEILHD